MNILELNMLHLKYIFKKLYFKAILLVFIVC